MIRGILSIKNGYALLDSSKLQRVQDKATDEISFQGSLSVSSFQDTLLVTTLDGKIHVINEDLQLLTSFQSVTGVTKALLLSRRAKQAIAVCSGRTSISIYLQTQFKQEYQVDSEQVISLANSLNGLSLALGCVSGASGICTLANDGTILQHRLFPPLEISPIRYIAIHDTGIATYLITGNDLGHLAAIDLSTGEGKLVYAHKLRISGLCISGDHWISSSFDGKIALSSLSTGLIRQLDMKSPILSMDLASTGILVATANEVKILPLETLSLHWIDQPIMDDLINERVVVTVPIALPVVEGSEEEMDETAKMLYGDF